MKLMKDKLPARSIRPDTAEAGVSRFVMTMGQLRVERADGIPTVIICLKTGEVAFADHLIPSEAASEFWDTLANIAAFKNFTR